MAKTKLSIDRGRDIFLHRTKVENLFISEYLPDAPGDYVKVFLFGLMYAQYEIKPDRSELAKLLGLSVEEIAEAWIYWESRGLVRIIREKDSNNEEVSHIVFLSKIEELYGKLSEPQQAATVSSEVTAEEDLPLYVSIDDMDFDEVINNKLVDRRLRELYEKYQVTTGRTISRQEISKIEDAIKVYGIEPEIFDFAIDYCADLEKYSIDYIFKVALRWTEDGCRTVEEAKRLLDRHSRRNDCYRQVFKALGFNRLPAPIDREIMDRWFDQMNCSLAEVLDACSAAAGLREPNLKYVNKVIENRRLKKGGINTRLPKDSNQNDSANTVSGDEGSPVSRKVLMDYFEFIRNEDEKEREARITEVLRKIPGMRETFEAESSINSKMLSLRPGADNLDTRQRLRAERIAIEESRKQLLTVNGFPSDYLARKYRCSICRDTGYTDEGMVCSCCKERAAEAFRWHTEKEKA
ncbi:MAG: DnaD domain protein [Mogibacterium sp.]|nr:DnaD domain protein [Mogibacterium sp.]